MQSPLQEGQRVLAGRNCGSQSNLRGTVVEYSMTYQGQDLYMVKFDNGDEELIARNGLAIIAAERP